MGKVILICGKIASGKTYYANQIKEQKNAVILNTDELTYAMFDNEQGEKYMELAERANQYLMKKAIDIVRVGCNVILDWGFWRSYNRRYMNEYFKNENIDVEWHYMDVDDYTQEENIKERNKKINDGLNKYDFYIDEGLRQKLIENWETPTKEEIDVWHVVRRDKIE